MKRHVDRHSERVKRHVKRQVRVTKMLRPAPDSSSRAGVYGTRGQHAAERAVTVRMTVGVTAVTVRVTVAQSSWRST